MIEKVYEKIYSIKVPLPRNPLRSLNSYFIIGNQRHLLIDTGFNMKECLDALMEAFNEIGQATGLAISFDEIDIFLTHLHSDHTGLVSSIATEKSKIYCSKSDGDIINSFREESYWKAMADIFSSHGMLDINDDSDKSKHPSQLFKNSKYINFETVNEGDTIQVGEYSLICIHTPGHTPGHMCLYEKNHKLLFSGDHVLGDITPVITVEIGMDNPLTLYLKSLDKVRQLEVKETFTAHRRKVSNFYERVNELKEHHRVRLEEVYGILESHGMPMTSYEMATKMKWHIRARSWEEFPRQQRWFATGEAMSHLLYLYENGKIKREYKNGLYKFTLTNTTI